MDRFIAKFPALQDGDDLMLCLECAYQKDRAHRVAYDEGYFNKCLSYEDQAIALAINRGRVELVAKHYDPVAPVVDIGIGSGEFIKKRPNTWGRDVNPVAVQWLTSAGRWAEDLGIFRAFTFWDVIEHIDTPEDYFQHIAPGAYLFTSVPIFQDLTRIRESRHYRPGEHLYYWTEKGFIDWMRLHRFELLERQTFEIDAGRDSVYSFAFRRAHDHG